MQPFAHASRLQNKTFFSSFLITLQHILFFTTLHLILIQIFDIIYTKV